MSLFSRIPQTRPWSWVGIILQRDTKATTPFTPFLSGADVIHPAPGSTDRPSFTALVGSIDNSAVRYVSTMEVQTSKEEIIEAMESMCTVCLETFLGWHDD